MHWRGLRSILGLCLLDAHSTPHPLVRTVGIYIYIKQASSVEIKKEHREEKWDLLGWENTQGTS